MRAAIVLAAGASRRFGRRDKLKARLGGRSLLDLAVANARACGACRVLLVSAARRRLAGVTHIQAAHAREGLSASLAAGLAALRPVEREILIFLADMPFACAPRLRLAAGVDAVRPCFRGQPGHPLLVRAAVAKARLGRGDKGLAGAIRARFVAGTAAHLIDIDTPDALRRARRHGSRGFRPRSTAD
jgi:molybdenum cofactor cytidylyltransferase